MLTPAARAFGDVLEGADNLAECLRQLEHDPERVTLLAISGFPVAELPHLRARVDELRAAVFRAYVTTRSGGGA